MSEGEDNEEIPSATTLHRRGSKDSGIESPPVLPDDEEHNSDVIDEDDLLLAPNEDPNDLKDGCTLASPEVPEEQGEVEEIRTPADEIDDVKTGKIYFYLAQFLCLIEPVDDEEYLRQIDAVKKLERKVVSQKSFLFKKYPIFETAQSEMVSRVAESIKEHLALFKKKEPEQAEDSPTPRALPALEPIQSNALVPFEPPQFEKKKAGKKGSRRCYTQFPDKLRMIARDINVPSVTFTDEGVGFIFIPDRFEQV